MLRVIHLASELAPIAKVGGLADVVTGLSKELIAQGALVEVILPKYDCMLLDDVEDLHIEAYNIPSYLDGTWVSNTIWTGRVLGVRVYFIEAHNAHPFFERGTFYGCPDDITRFSYFARAALEWLHQSHRSIDILHLHDWQTALAAVLFWDIYQPLGLQIGRIVFTLHNMEHQGRGSTEDLSKIGLDGRKYLVYDKLADNDYPASINLAKGGIVYANAVTTVSPTYAREVQQDGGGHGLSTTLQIYAHKFSGIINGLDTQYWDPATDKFLTHHYTIDDPSTLSNKKLLKTSLQKRLGLHITDAPLVATISRLVPQKGVDLLEHALFHTLKLGGQFVLVGSSPITSIRDHFAALKAQFAHSGNVFIELMSHEELAHHVYAAADMFLVPSIFEPCGLTQLIAMRYGAIPIVRKTGGLSDTVTDFTYPADPSRQGNGFVFNDADTNAIEWALSRAFAWRHDQPAQWDALLAQAMRADNSWHTPAQAYLSLYNSLLNT